MSIETSSTDLVMVLQFSIGLLYAAAATPKLRAPRQFAISLLDYDFVPGSLAWPLAWIVMALEAFAALALLTGFALKAALVVGVLITAGFAMVVSFVLLKGLTRRCLCFGAQDDETISAATLVRLLLMLLIESYLLWTRWDAPVLSIQMPLGWLDWFVGVAAAGMMVTAASWILATPAMIGAWQQCRACRARRR